MSKADDEVELIKSRIVDRKTSLYDLYDVSNYIGMSSNGDEKRIAILKDRRKEIQNTLNQIDKCIDEAKKLKFKEGDVAFTKADGPMVICDITVNMNELSYGIDTKEPYKFYYKGYTKNGLISVRQEDVMPYNEATKLLYEKSKKE